MSEGGKEAVRVDEDVVAASEVRRLEERVRELERLLGRKTMEFEILKEALDLARVKKTLAVAVAASGGYPVKRIAETLGVARSNLIEQAAGKRRKRGPQTRRRWELTKPKSGAWWTPGQAMGNGGSPRSSSVSGQPPASIASMPSGSTG
jgi:transposase